MSAPRCRGLAVLLIALLGMTIPGTVEADEPIKALYVTGGGWHDYEAQERIVTDGLSERAAIAWTIENEAGDDSGHWPERFEQDDWMAGFDVVVYNFCITEVPGADQVNAVVQQHVDLGVPAVFLHAAIHSFRADTRRWFAFGGVRSHRHEAHRPFHVAVLAAEHPIMQGFPAEGWNTPEGELYEIEEVYENAVPLAEAYGKDTDQHHPVIWTNEYEGVRVFGTTIGHHNVTMEDPIYLDFVVRGLLWSVGKLNDDASTAGQAGVGGEPAASDEGE